MAKKTAPKLIRYPDDYNPILEYYAQIQTGQVVVSNKVRKTFQHLKEQIDHPGEYFYSPRRANHILEFAENFCRHSKGKLGGQRVVLELWEKAILSAVFGFVDIEGVRQYNQVLLIIGRKNGKSLISSIVGLYLLVGDGGPGPEVYSVATKKEQARIIWAEAKRMVNKSPALKKRIRTLVAEMDSDFNDGVFKALASDSDTLDGLNVSGAMIDEIHAWKNGRALFDVVVDGEGAREQPLTFITTTAGTVREDIYDLKYDEAKRIVDGYGDPTGYKDDHTLAFIYELDKRSEWEDPACWMKANPGLGTIKSYDTLAEKVRKAQQNRALVKNLLTKEFNIPETTSEAWLTAEQVINPAVFSIEDLKPRYGIGGVDLSKTTDLTAAKVLFMVPDDPHKYVLSMYWMPEDLVEKRVHEDHIPYDVWIERGLMRTCPGNQIRYQDITSWFQEIQTEYDIYIYKVGYDSWSAKYWVDDMTETFGQGIMVPVIQGKKTCSAPLKSLGADLEAKLVVYNDNPIDKWCLFNSVIDRDINDNISLIHSAVPTRRNDGASALMDAYVILQNNLQEYQSLI